MIIKWYIDEVSEDETEEQIYRRFYKNQRKSRRKNTSSSEGSDLIVSSDMGDDEND